MAKPGSFLLVTWDGGGNVQPLVALANRLRERGHTVRALAEPSLGTRFRAEGIAFRPHRTGAEWTHGNPVVGPDATDEQRAAYLRGMADDVAAEARRRATDALVVDFMQPDALCGAERTRIPTAAFLHTLYTRVAMTDFNPMGMIADAARINVLRSSMGLSPVERLTDLLDHSARVLVTTVPELDRPDGSLAANVRFVGPIVEDAGPDSGWTPPWPSADVPLVVVGMGTTPMDETPVLQRALDALAPLPVRVFATVGGHLSPADVRPPANAAVTGYVRHAAVMPHAAVFVTHAGLSGIGAALACGVPMVCVPLGREQPFNAEHLARTGAGIALTRDATPAELRDAVSAVLADPSYRGAAASMREAVAAYGNGARAVDQLEQLL
ncbi:MAG TPA: glycosyltransferase [Dehalococcoidia bacterium]|nr:glycosyltransferase [Dehalococcoidia bacterium]